MRINNGLSAIDKNDGSKSKGVMMMKWVSVLGFGTIAFIAVCGANAATPVKAGTLTCSVSGGWGLVFGSSKDLRCIFRPVSGRPEHYLGTISKFGVDIGYTEGGIVVWEVFVPEAKDQPGTLAGNYGGASASATVAVGLGANVLVGGSNNAIALQPISIEGNTGLNVAAGVAAIQLRPGYVMPD